MALQGTPGNNGGNVVQFRIERGALAMGTDEALGTVEQIVVDRETGELRALIVRSNAGDGEFELPANHVMRATGDHVYLDIGRSDLASHPDLANPYNPLQYVPVYQNPPAPGDEATRTAISTEHPVVTGVEEDAAELVAPETATADANTMPLPFGGAAPEAGEQGPVDERVTAPTESAAQTTQPLRDGGVSRPTDSPPSARAADSDIDAGQPAVQIGPTIGQGGSTAPSVASSTTPESTGALIGRRPSTSGMGANASVPAADEFEYEQGRPEETDPERASPRAGMAEAFREAGSRPSAVLDDQLTAAEADEATTALNGMEAPRPLDRGDRPGSGPISMLDTVPAAATLSGTTPPDQAATAEPPMPGVGSRMTVQLPQRPREPSHSTLLAAAGLGASIGLGILLRQRTSRNQRTQRARRQARESARAARSQATETIQSMGSALQQVGEQARQATTQAAASTQMAAGHTRRAAKRIARRGRWFRRGLMLGSALALLFAPEPGAELREQIASRLQRWRARGA
jgi:gas vesicle protein